MIKKFFLLFSLASIAVVSQMQAVLQLPEKFYIKERWISWTTTFDIETDAYRLGTVHRKFFSWTTTYNFCNFNGDLEARARMRFFSWGTIFDITDVNEGPLGQVSEKLFRFLPTFEIIAPTGEKLADAKMNFWGTKYSVYSPIDKHLIGKLSRSFFRIKDDWTVNIYDPSAIEEGKIDPRLFVTLMAFQTDVDHWKNQQFIQGVEVLHPEAEAYNRQLDKGLALLAPYSEALSAIEPEQEDFAAVEEIADELLSDTEDPIKETLRLLEGSCLTPVQKSALCMMAKKVLLEKKSRL